MRSLAKLIFNLTADHIVYTVEKNEVNFMFVKVQDLTTIIDKRLQYLEEGRASKDNHDADTYNKWLADITRTLENNIKKLKMISCNDNLVKRYENKVEKALKG